MSAFDEAMAAADADLFAEFGEAATVQRGAEPAVPVTVYVQRGQARYGEFGQLVARVTTCDFRVAEWDPQPGDLVTVASLGAARKVDTIEAHDGAVAQAVLHG